jgi:hypothetical protein
MRDSEAVLSPKRRVARLDLCSDVAVGGATAAVFGELDRVGGRCDIQSCTSKETLGFDWRFSVFWDDGGVVIIIVGAGEKGVDGRYVYFIKDT